VAGLEMKASRVACNKKELESEPLRPTDDTEERSEGCLDIPSLLICGGKEERLCNVWREQETGESKLH
jgi:hypothetical protein